MRSTVTLSRVGTGEATRTDDCEIAWFEINTLWLANG